MLEMGLQAKDASWLRCSRQNRPPAEPVGGKQISILAIRCFCNYLMSSRKDLMRHLQFSLRKGSTFVPGSGPGQALAMKFWVARRRTFRVCNRRRQRRIWPAVPPPYYRLVFHKVPYAAGACACAESAADALFRITTISYSAPFPRLCREMADSGQIVTHIPQSRQVPQRNTGRRTTRLRRSLKDED